MEPYQQHLLLHLIETGALIFQPTIIKSGRVSPYYFSLRRAVNTGHRAFVTCTFYAEHILEHVGLDFDYLHGPAYAGIPLAAVTSAVLWEHHGVDKRWGYDRKEEKAYGEKGAELIVGDLRDGDKVLMQDYVVSTGKTKFENWNKIRSTRSNLVPKGMLVTVDREEKDEDGRPATLALEEAGLKVFSILKIREVFEWMRNREINGRIHVTDQLYEAFIEYLKA